jgi:hypothetical protein
MIVAAACGDDSGSSAGSDTSTGTTELATSSDTSSGVAPTTELGSEEGSTTAIGDATSSSDGTGTSSDGGSEDSSTGAPSFADPRGYTLIAPFQSRFTYLFDADGQEINAWESEVQVANSAYLLENGHLLRAGRDPTPAVELVSGAGGVIEEYDWDGNLVWQYEYTGPDIVAHHDIEVLPSGNVLVIAYEMFTADEAIQAGHDPSLVTGDGKWADHLVEIDRATGSIVWEWHVWDHLVQDFDPAVDNYGVVGDHPERIDINWPRPGDATRPDWTHINAVAYDAELDQIVLSPRSFSEIWIIDHSTTTQEAASHEGGDTGMGGDLLYRWGNPETWDAGDALDRQLFFQHDPHWLGAGAATPGNMIVFDNGDPTLRPWSRVIEIEPPVLPDGTYELDGGMFGPAAPVWSYESPDDFFAPFISGADRLSDGRTVVCDGPLGRIFEVTPRGDVPWEFTVPTSIFRAPRYEADHPAWNGLTEAQLAPKGPLVIELEPR